MDAFFSSSYHSVLLTASPNPGVSTIVSFSFTPFSSMSTVCFVISTVWWIRSLERDRQYVPHQHYVCILCTHSHLKKPLTGDSPSALSSLRSLCRSICQEQTVYQGGFAQARLTCNTVNHNTDASMRLLSSPQGPKMYHYCVVQKHTSSKTILNVIWVSSPDRRTTDGIYTQYKWDLQNQVFFSYSLRNMSIMLKMCTIGSAHLQP